MSKLHIANTSFEWELIQSSVPPIEKVLASHPIYAQLQFLPFLYADDKDAIAVSSLPETEYFERLSTIRPCIPSLILLSEKTVCPYKIEPWGVSPSIEKWAKDRQIKFACPSYACVKEVNSKEFSYVYSPKLAGSGLFYSLDEALHWLRKTNGPRVLKTSFGVSGRGHFLIKDEGSYEKAALFLKRHLREGEPVIGESWVHRLIDFSTQWEIKNNGEVLYFGVTLCENDDKGSYRKTIVGDQSAFPTAYSSFLNEHADVAKILLKTIKEKGFYGNVGFDAMVYKDDGTKSIKLHPIVEINARKTMGWAALCLQRKHFSDKTIAMHFTSHGSGNNLLPDCIFDKEGNKSTFSKRLVLDVLTT